MGKTTLIRSILALQPPTVTGSILFGDAELVGLAPERISRLGIGLVPQGRRVFASLSVLQNLTIAMRSDTGRPTWGLADIFELFPVLDERGTQMAGTLSGGEQQMLALARAMLTNPQVLLMDEPAEGLAPGIVRRVQQIVNDLKERRQSVLLVEQNVAFALEVADEVYVLERGRIVFHDLPQVLMKSPTAMQQYLGV
jgi:branched-chain amino acid transport system ATP-binding protein